MTNFIISNLSDFLLLDVIKIIISYYNYKLPFEKELLMQTMIIKNDLEKYKYGIYYNNSIYANIDYVFNLDDKFSITYYVTDENFYKKNSQKMKLARSDLSLRFLLPVKNTNGHFQRTEYRPIFQKDWIIRYNTNGNSCVRIKE